MGTFGQMIGKAVGNARNKHTAQQKLDNDIQAATQFENEYESLFGDFLMNGLDWYESKRTTRTFTSLMEKAKLGNGVYDFSVFDGVDPAIMANLQKNFSVLCYQAYKSQATGVIEKDFWTIEIALFTLSRYAHFEAFRPMIEHTTRHKDYFDSNACLESIMTIRDHQFNPDKDDETSSRENDRSWIKDLYGGSAVRAVDDCGLVNWYPTRSKFQDLVEVIADVAKTELQPSAEELLSSNELVSEAFVKAMDIIAGADKDIEDYNMLKTALLRAVEEDMSDEANIVMYNFIVDAAKTLMSAQVQWEENGETRHGIAYPVDVVLAESTRLHKAGMVDDIDSMLAEQIELYAHASFDCAEQLTLLASHFGAMGAYKQELAVLECMVANNLPRTEQMEAMLSFLRGGGAKTMESMSGQIEVDYKAAEGKIAIDYRVLSWSDNQITALFDIESGKNSLMKTPLVIAEWSKSIPTSNVRWNDDAVAQRVRKCIAENFGEALEVGTREVATIMDGELDYADAIMIAPTADSKYPWLGFVLSGEQMTLKQASLSLFGLYFPEKDFDDEKSWIQRNKKAGNRAVMLKMKQNPRINNYISMVESLIVDTLEEYFNGDSVEDIY